MRQHAKFFIVFFVVLLMLIKKGSTTDPTFIDCKKCWGHGVNPSADPRCRFGCGTIKSYPVVIKTGGNVPNIITFPTLVPGTISKVTDRNKVNVAVGYVIPKKPLESWTLVVGIGIVCLCLLIIVAVGLMKRKTYRRTNRVSFSESEDFRLAINYR